MGQITGLPQFTGQPSPTDELAMRDASTGIDKRVGFDILVRDPLRKAVEAQTGGRITVLYDDLDQPSYMHVLPRFGYDDLGYTTELGTGTATAFDADGAGTYRSEVFIGVYMATILNGRACSLPYKDPAVSINFDAARLACTSKGAGWHLFNRHEWAAVAFWCMANGFEPRGNTNYGRAHDAPHEVAVRQDGLGPGGAAGTARTLTGGGPATWRHTGDYSGIADLVGNCWDWLDGLKLVDGQCIVMPHNDPTIAEASWTALGDYFSDESNVLTLQNAPGIATTDALSVDWAAMAKDPSYVESELLNRMLISPAGIAPQGRFYVLTQGERLPFCGGNWDDGGSAGLAALYLGYPRSFTNSGVSFRPAFVA